MPYVNRFHRDFPQDLAAATAYYDAISDRLGERFRGNVRQLLKTIGERPESFGFVSEQLRAAMTFIFPILFCIVSLAQGFLRRFISCRLKSSTMV